MWVPPVQYSRNMRCTSAALLDVRSARRSSTRDFCGFLSSDATNPSLSSSTSTLRSTRPTASFKSNPAWSEPIATRVVHLDPAICSLTAAITWSRVKPNFICNCSSGAEAPNVSMPMLRPVGPT
jgi:hypothetical protein